MNVWHECKSVAGEGRMMEFERTEGRVPYRESMSDAWRELEHDPTATIKPIKYWQPWHCKHCHETVFELIDGSV